MNIKKAYEYYFIIWIFALTILSCHTLKTKQQVTMEYIPEIFGKVKINSKESNLCSPAKPGPEWIGILINAPNEIRIEPGEKNIVIPLCGFFQLEHLKLRKSEPMKIFVVQSDPKTTYTGMVVEQDESPEIPNEAPPVEDKDLEGMTLGSYFNYNILSYVIFPSIPGDYKVYVEYAGSKSNIALFKIRTK